MTVKDARKFKYPSDLENSREFFYEVTYNISEFIKSIRISVRDYLPGTKSRHFTLDLSQDKILASNGKTYEFEVFFKSLNWVNFGQCHTFQVEANMKKHVVRDNFCHWSKNYSVDA